MKAREQRDLFVVVVDPRFTSTCEAADLHLPILPGQDVALFNGLLQYLWKNGHADQEFIAQHTQGLEQALVQSEAESPIQEVAQRTGIAVEKLQTFIRNSPKLKKL